MEKLSLERVLSAKELALILNINEWTVMGLARSAELPCEYVNRRPRFHLKALIEYFRQKEGCGL